MNINMTGKNKKLEMKKGQAVMAVVLFMLFIGTAGVLAFSFISLGETSSSKTILNSERSFFLSEAGNEDVSYRIIRGKTYSTTETLILDGFTATTTVITQGPLREVESIGTVQGGTRKVKTSLRSGAGSSFFYGIQVGRGGFLLENNAVVNGSIYSSGNVVMQNDAVVNGDVFIASTSHITGNAPKTLISGSARARYISDSVISKNATSSGTLAKSTVSGHAYADRISGSTITLNAYYLTSIATSTVSGSSFPGTPAPADLPVIPLPISDSDIDAWETIAEGEGTYTGPCPYLVDDETINLGPLKINCDLLVQNDGIIILNGPVWVVGDITLQNDAIAKLPVSYGSNSEVLIADNPSNRTTSSKIVVKNNAQTLGSGTNGSYIISISQNNSAELGGTEVAVQPQNNATNTVFYAAHGKILLENNVGLKEATAYIIHAKNNSVLNYETGLQNLSFSQGPSGGYTVEAWKEVE